jgi:DNA polymerase (family 10)
LRNDQYSALLNRIADLLEIKGEMFFKVRSYREAARQIDELSEPLDQVRADGRLDSIHGIGKAIAEKLDEYGKAGRLEYLQKLETEVPPGLLDFLRIQGLGPRTAKDIYDALGITTLPELEKALKAGDLGRVPRLKAKSQENIAKGLEALKGRGEAARVLLPKAMDVAQQFVNALSGMAQVERIEPAGSLRRRAESIGDIDLVVAATEAAPIMETFTNLGMVADVIAQGETKSSVRTTDGIQVDIRVVAPEVFGAALCYFTGSKAHNVRMRALALKQGMTLNEYGLARLAADADVDLPSDLATAPVGALEEAEAQLDASISRLAVGTRSRAVVESAGALPCASEEEVYVALGLAWIPPVMREDRGEIALAAEGKLPRLLQPKDIRGDLHCHTDNSDGRATIEEMAAAAIERGYEYLAITDHSRSQGIVQGIEGATYRDQIARVRAAARKIERQHKGFRLLAGVEVNVLPDGTLDVPDDILADLDVVVASVHSQFRQPKDEMTTRICRAAMHPHVDIIGHPTGRKIETRNPYDVDMEEVMKAALKGGTALEINGSPQRLDVNDMYARRARGLGIKLAIGSDGHTPRELTQVEFGSYVAQRAWLQPADVLNCWKTDKLLSYLKH